MLLAVLVIANEGVLPNFGGNSYQVSEFLWGTSSFHCLLSVLASYILYSVGSEKESHLQILQICKMYLSYIFICKYDIQG